MTAVHLDIINPAQLYSELGIPDTLAASEGVFIGTLRSKLVDKLSKNNVTSVTIGIKKINSKHDLYKIFMVNTKNDWQEEEIRLTCDEVCLSFMKKENLLLLKEK